MEKIFSWSEPRRIKEVIIIDPKCGSWIWREIPLREVLYWKGSRNRSGRRPGWVGRDSLEKINSWSEPRRIRGVVKLFLAQKGFYVYTCLGNTGKDC